MGCLMVLSGIDKFDNKKRRMPIPFKSSQYVNYDTLLEGNEKNEEQEGQGGAPSGLEKTRGS